jgi:flagellar hook-length control protein FliK
VERLTASVIPSISKNEMTAQSATAASPSTRISPDQVERLTTSVIPSFSKRGMAAEQERMERGPVYARPERPGVKESVRVEIQADQEEMSTARTTEPEEMVQAALKDPQSMEESHRELRQAGGTTTRMNSGIEQQSSQPSLRAANTVQPALEWPFENTESAGRILQVETSGQGNAVANGPSVNLASSIAPVVDGKVTVIHRSIEESTSNSSSNEIAGTDGASSGETKVSASQESDGAGRQNSRESTGQGPSLSSYEKSSGPIAADQSARNDASTAQQNFNGSNAAAPQEIEAQNTDQDIDNHVSSSKAQDDPITVSGKDHGGFTRDGAAAQEQGSAFAGRDQGSPTTSSGQPWDPSIQRPQETAHTTFTASPTGAHSSGASISLEHPSWPENLSQRLHQLQQEGRSQMTLEVEPRDMGRLSLRIETQQNQVIAYISTDNEQTKALLMQHASDLRQHLQDQGLQLGQFSVEVRKDGSNNRNGYQRKSSTGRDSARAQTVQGSDADGAAAAAVRYGRRGGEQTISLFA